MIFGFIFGIILSYVALSLFNRGFAIAIQFLNDYNGDIFNLIYQLAMMAIYTTAVLTIMNRCFAMIYEVPNKVLRWIGGPQESGHEESMLQGIRHQHDRDVGQIGQLVPSAQYASQSGSANSQLSNTAQEAQQSSASSGGGEAPSAAGGGGSAAGSGSGAAASASAISPVVP